MPVPRVLVAAVAFLALAGLPCLLAVVVVADIAFEHGWRALRAVRHRSARARPPVLPAPRLPIEHIAADLRRLSRARVGVASRSGVWFVAVQRAYDDRLRLACQALEVPEYLDRLDGIDREIERLRVEGELQAAGLVLDTSGAGSNRDRP